MTLPKTIAVGGQRVKVLRADLSDDDFFGYYSHDKRTIVIDITLTGERLRKTFRHELKHAALNIGGVAFCKGFEEEAILRGLDELFWPVWERWLRKQKL
tara:strand:+ start:673 stop:969 length:297 start_codon:yes stop_codon:yes gene_type:complete